MNADLKTGFAGAIEEIGEGMPIGVHSICENKLLTPNLNRTKCVLPSRVDVGRHFIITGGPDAIRENVADMTARVQSFGRYITNLESHPLFLEIFNDPKFKKNAESVCPESKRFLDPFQVNFILQVPGQTVATHLDAPVFWGATRMTGMP